MSYLNQLKEIRMKTLRDVNPIAAEQWEYVKNGELTPDNVSAKSGRLVSFICSDNSNHRWEAKVYQRTKEGRNIDCPYCDERKVLRGETDLFTKCPIAKEYWDYEANGELDPNQLLYISNKKVHFKCKRGHTFIRHVRDFIKTPGCRKCDKYENSIKFTHPNIVRMWDYEKNKPDIPSNHLKTSSKKVYWKCPKCGYSWQCKVVARTVSKGLCPACEVGSAFMTGVNDLATKHKNLLKYWDYDNNVVSPSEVHLHDIRKFNWLCPDCNYSWSATAISRYVKKKGEVRKLRNCPSCEGKVVVANRNDISITHPHLAAEYVEILNTRPLSEIKRGSNYNIHWKCSECNQYFVAKPSSRTRYKDGKLHGCPYCAGKLPIPGINDFKTLKPVIADEWDYDANDKGPEEYTVYSMKNVYWKCKNDNSHKWLAAVQARSKGGYKCPICYPTRKKVPKFSNAHPEHLQYWDYNKNKKAPDQYNQYSNAKVWWICSEGHEFQQVIGRIAMKGFYCVICENSYLVEGINDVATVYPRFVEIWDYEKNEVTPNQVRYAENVYYHYRCNLGHSWWGTLKSVVDDDYECVYCSGKRVLSGLNSFKDLYPELTEEWNHEINSNRPDKTSIQYSHPITWKCSKCNMDYLARIRERINGSKTCPYCSGKRAIPGKTSLKALYPQLAEKYSSNNTVTADEVLPNYSLYVNWTCSKYHVEWSAPVVDVVEGRRTCPYCDGARAVPGVNSLKALYPELLHDFVDERYNPDEILPTLTSSLQWKCHKNGLMYNAGVDDFIKYGCPYCNGRRVVPGRTSFKALHPQLARKFVDQHYDADTILPGHTRVTKWKCSKYDLIYEATVKGMVEGNENCPYCSERKVVPGVNSLNAMYPDIAIRLIDENHNAENVFPWLKVRVKWKCSEYGLPYYASINGIVNGTEVCPYCSGKQVVPGATSLKALYPELGKKMIDTRYDPDFLFPNSSKRVRWQCSKHGLSYYATIKDIVIGLEKCPYCAGKKVVPGVTSLKALYAEIVSKEWKYLANALLGDPDEILSTSKKRYFWECETCKSTYVSSPKYRVRMIERKMTACKFCKGLRTKYDCY